MMNLKWIYSYILLVDANNLCCYAMCDNLCGYAMCEYLEYLNQIWKPMLQKVVYSMWIYITQKNCMTLIMVSYELEPFNQSIKKDITNTMQKVNCKQSYIRKLVTTFEHKENYGIH